MFIVIAHTKTIIINIVTILTMITPESQDKLKVGIYKINAH